MLNSGYLIPANSKKGQLIFNFFRPIDLGIFGAGLGISLLLLVIVGTSNLWTIILVLLPGAIATLLVAPVPNHHNVLVLIMGIYHYLNHRRNYVWKGWCIKDGDKQ